MNKHKILFACNAYDPMIGGAEKVCKRMVEILSKDSEVTVLTQPCPERKDKIGIVEMKGKSSYSYMPELNKYLNTHDFDLYISFGYGKYFTDYIGWWTKKHNKPSIVMPCGFFHTNQKALSKVLYSTIATKFSLNNFSARVTATAWEKDFWNTRFGVTNSNSFVISYNLEPGFTNFKSTKILSEYKLKNKKYLLYIGRTGPNKLIDLLIEAYNKTDKKIPLVIAGKGTEIYRTMGYDKKIIVIGGVSEDEKKTLIKGAKLCIFPSSFESFGMVLLESLALKTPTIGSNIGPFKEILQRDELLFENNSDALARKISRAYEDDYDIPQINMPSEEAYLRGLVYGLKHKVIPLYNNDPILQFMILDKCSDYGLLKDNRAQADAGTIVWAAIIIFIIIIGFVFFLQYFKAFISWLRSVVLK